MKRCFEFALMALGIPWIWKTLAAIAVASLLVWLCGCTYLEMRTIEKINHPFQFLSTEHMQAMLARAEHPETDCVWQEIREELARRKEAK